MDKINKNAIKKYLNLLHAREDSIEVIVRKIQSLKKFFAWALQRKLISKSVYQQIKETIDNFQTQFLDSSVFFPSEKKTPLTIDFNKAKYFGEKKSQGIFGEISIKFHLQTYKIKSILSGFLKRIPFFEKKPLPSVSSEPVSEIQPPITIYHYIAFFVILLFISFLGAGLYNRFFLKLERPLAYPLTPVRAGRTLNFQGRLTDSLGNPITSSTNVQFKLYNVSTGGTPLYQTGTCAIIPDQDGIFNVIIGSDCGSEIDNAVFTENPNVFLGVTVGADNEMTPRQPIANVGYAINAETLQGLPPGTSVANIPFINKDGDLLIAIATPGIRSTYASANFSISSAGTTILQSAGTGDVILQATESGTIKLRTGGINDSYTRLFINNAGNVGIGTITPSSMLYVKSSSAATPALSLEHAASPISDYFQIRSSGATGGDILTVDSSGRVGIGTTSPSYKLDVQGGTGIVGRFSGRVIGGEAVNSNEFVTLSQLQGGAGSLWLDGGDYLYPNNSFASNVMVPAGRFGVGLTSTPFRLEVTGNDAGKALASFNYTGTDQNILVASQSGSLRFAVGYNGNITATGTITGLTGITSSGIITFSGLTANGPVYTSTGGVLNSETYLSTTRGGLGADVTAAGAGELLYSTGTTTYGRLAAGSSGQILKSGGAGSPTWNSPAALTKTDDTNVTLTLGGSPSTALVNPASITVSWTGQLAVGRGGTGLSSLASGSLIYGSGSSPVNTLAIGSANYVLVSNGTAPSWGTIGGSSITPDSLDFSEFQDILDLDTGLTLNQSTYTWTQNFTGTTTTGLTYNANSLTSGTGLAILSSSTGLTGDLVKVEASGNNAGVTGNVLKIGLTGASATGTALNVTTAGSSGFALRVNDDGTYTDTTPFVIDVSGNVGIGTTSPSYKLDVSGTFHASGDSYFGSNVYFANGTTYYVDSSGNAKFLDLIAADTGNPGLTVGDGSIGFLKIGSSTIFDNNTTYLSLDPNSDLTPEMVITDSGNVGIGTTGPGARLHVVAAGGFGNEPIRAQSGSTFFSGVDAGGTQRFAINNDSGPTLNFYGWDTAWFNWMTVNNAGTRAVSFNAGNVGIGTTAPLAKLHAGTAVSDYSTYSFANTGAVITSVGVDHTAARTNALALMRDGTSGVVFAGLAAFDLSRWSNDGVNARTQLDIRLADTNTNTLTDVLSLRSNGNVGIGTTAPTRKLDVAVNGDSIEGIRLTRTGGTGDPNSWILWNMDADAGYGDDFEIWQYPQSGGALQRFEIQDDGDIYIPGNVGIGTTGPAGKLDVAGDTFVRAAGTQNKILLRGGDNNVGLELRSETTGGTPYIDFANDATVDYDARIILAGNGLLAIKGAYVGIGTTAPAYQLELPNYANSSGQGRANAWVTYSDISLKENIMPIENALDKIISLRGVTFDWKGQGIHSSGFIAQEVEPIIPELVTTSNDGLKSLDYGRFTPYLVEAIKQQQNQIFSLSTQLTQLADLSLNSTGDLEIRRINTDITDDTDGTNYVYDGVLDLQSQISNLKTQNYILKNKLTGEIINRIAAFSELIVAKIRTGLMETENALVNNTLIAKKIIAENLSITTENLTIAGKTLSQYIDERVNNILNSRQLFSSSEKIITPVIETEEIQLKTQNAKLKTTAENSKLSIVDKNDQPTAEFDTQNQRTSIFGSLEVKNDENKGKLAEIVLKGLEGKTVARIDASGSAYFAGTVTALSDLNTLSNLSVGQNATISGSLTVSEASLSGRLVAREVNAENINALENSVASVSSSVNSVISSVESVFSNINDIQKLLAEIKNQPLPDPNNLSNLSTLSNLNDLTVTGNTNLYNASVANSLLVGNLFMENDKILSLSWELKLSALSQINLFDGAVLIAKDGNITTRGTLIAQGGIKTDTIAPRSSSDLSILGNLNILGDLRLQKATDSAVIAASENFAKRGVFAPAIETATASAGFAKIPAHQNEVIVYNDRVKPDSLIYITKQGTPSGEKLSVAEKAVGYFKVVRDSILPVESRFDWLIIN